MIIGSMVTLFILIALLLFMIWTKLFWIGNILDNWHDEWRGERGEE